MKRPGAAWRVLAACLGCSSLLGGAGFLAQPASGATLAVVPRSRMKVTEGTLRQRPDGRLSVEGPRLRAIVPDAKAPRAELRFSLLGASGEQRALQSGEQRQQVGLKLRARDGCNVLYVMWRLAPKPGLVVSYKHNPGQHRSNECGNQGYVTVRPYQSVPQGAPAPGQEHSLRAVLHGVTLRVWVDKTLAWEGDLPPEALTLEGPVGVRSDNVSLTFQLLASPR